MNAGFQVVDSEMTTGRTGRGSLIINADDWGGWKSATDAALTCHRQARITSVSAMVYMEDSERGAELAKAHGMDAGLHLNFNQEFSDTRCPRELRERQGGTRRFLRRGRYAQLVYNPMRKRDFEYCYQAQLREFERLYGKLPSHFDGHQHMHLCANMLLGGFISKGAKVRRNFSFWPGEKGALNRWYRGQVDRALSRRHIVTDYFFSLAQALQWNRIARIAGLASAESVELMTHPEKPVECEWLLGKDFLQQTEALRKVSYEEFCA